MLPVETLRDIEKNLLDQKQQLENQLKSLQKNDPMMLGTVDVPFELGTGCWEEEVHEKAVVASDRLNSLYQKIKESLTKLQQGTYGKCEGCGKLIEPERLAVLPVATHCTLCL